MFRGTQELGNIEMSVNRQRRRFEVKSRVAIKARSERNGKYQLRAIDRETKR